MPLHRWLMRSRVTLVAAWVGATGSMSCAAAPDSPGPAAPEQASAADAPTGTDAPAGTAEASSPGSASASTDPEPAAPKQGAGESAAIDPRLQQLAVGCSEAAIGEVAPATGEVPAPPVDCVRLADMLPTATTELERDCQRGTGPACGLLGAALLQRKTTVLSVELHSRPCSRGKDDCYGHSRRLAQIPFRAPRPDEARASEYLTRACNEGQPAACVEVGLALSQRDRIKAAELFRRGCLGNSAASCAEAVYLVRATSRVDDPELHAHAATVLSAQCEKGGALGCNNFAFMVERRMVPERDEQQAASLYAKSCTLGEATGCANLIFFAENHRQKARALPFGNAANTLASACANRPDEPILCVASALARRRGFGIKAELRTSTKQLKELCQAGAEDACGVR